MPADTLTPRQRRFVEEYLLDLNATQAAIRAGYSERTANEQGARLLANVSVRQAIQEGQKERSERTHVQADAVLRDLATLCHSRVTDYVIDDEGNVTLSADAPPDAMRAVSSVKRRTLRRGKDLVEVVTELRLWSKPDAIRLALQHLGMLTNRVELAAAPQVTIFIPDNGRDSYPSPDEPPADSATPGES